MGGAGKEALTDGCLISELRLLAPKSIPTHETFPAPLQKILARFGPQKPLADRGRKLSSTEDWLIRMSLQSVMNSPFSPQVYPPGKEREAEKVCPHYPQVLLGFLLTGRMDPSGLRRFNQTLCGHLVSQEDTIGIFGPLSGRRGISLDPFSRCWVVKRELTKLVEFMKAVEEPPTLPPEGIGSLSEGQQLDLLNRRKEVRQNSERRGLVMASWLQVLEENPQLVQAISPLLSAGSGKKETAVEGKEMELVLQFKIGGEEYMSLVRWVDERVLKPLAEVVGESLAPRTALNCPKSPRPEFIGEMSLI